MVTVIIPTYNRASLVEEAIRSVLAQTYTDLELIVVDDHSTDHTKQLVEQIARDDPRVIYRLNERTKGAQGARNTGIFQAKGEWLAFQDSDDLWHPKRLECHFQMLKQLPDAEVVGTACRQLKTDPVQSPKPGASAAEVPFTGNWTIDNDWSAIREKSKVLTQDYLLYGTTGSGFPMLVCRRAAALQVGGVDERFQSMQDIDFYVALAGVGRIVLMDLPLVKVRVGDWVRITSSYARKLNGAQLLEEKYRAIAQPNLRLRLRNSNRALVYCVLAGHYGEAFRRTPHFAYTLLIEPKAALKAVKLLAMNILRSK